VRVSAAACLLGVLGALGGAWLIARWAFGLTLLGLSVSLIVWGLLRDDGTQPRAEHVPVSTLHDVLERARRSA
jgi:hypothetical protein